MMRRFVSASCLLLVAPSACTGLATPTGAPVPATSTTPIAVATASPVRAVPSSGVVTPRVETVVTGLDGPWELVFAPDGRMFVTERAGRVRLIAKGRLDLRPMLTLGVATSAEAGLLGMALDPASSTNHFVYLYYTYADAQRTRNRVSRYREAEGALVEERVLLDNLSGGSIHDGGRIAFGPDGKLYVTVGDAGNAQSAQDLASPNGKILRMEADGASPSDNPFPGSLVYSYGNRNPQGLAWQPGTNVLFDTEHGQTAHDEVNRIQLGANYG